jgi:hypothetical protein
MIKGKDNRQIFKKSLFFLYNSGKMPKFALDKDKRDK